VKANSVDISSKVLKTQIKGIFEDIQHLPSFFFFLGLPLFLPYVPFPLGITNPPQLVLKQSNPHTK
jgi:hypothetical protein